jgi:tetratricopeptide (TPR) repeat protein
MKRRARSNVEPSVSKATKAVQTGMSGVKLGRQQGASTGDLLKQIEGVDGLLTKGVQLRWLGRFGATASSAALAALAKYHAPSWGLAIAAAGLAVSAALVSQGREWIKSSRQAFRYTFSVAPFEPASQADANGENAESLRRACDWIRADLILMLSDRIRRLSVLPEEEIPPDTPDRPASHIHISGTYGSRTKNGEKTIELMPLVRIGSQRCSATVAFWVRHTTMNSEERDLTQDRVAYDQILERLYFSVATQIYKQIRLDVARKISRLPTQYLRATAYFYEAEDYARSNTLDAFDDASKLYTKALDLYDRMRRPLPEHAWQRPLKWLLRALAPRWRGVARRLAWVWPRFGRRPVQIARSETGRAKALLFRNVLANLSGREPQSVFEARRLVREAIDELEKLPDGVEGLTEARFEGYVVAAFAEQWALDFEAAKERLAKADDLWPDHRKALFPFVSAGVEPRLQRKIRLLRRAVELDPRFEIAHFEIAFNLEQLWRTGEELEPEGGKLVEAAYQDVTGMNPANITAWANLGYVRWLMWDPEKNGNADEVAQPFRDGRRYKEIRQKTFVAELDYGLARVAAERGNIAKAYEHYINASGATMAQEATSGYIAYCFDRVNEPILMRFKRYKTRVLDTIDREPEVAAAEGREPLPARILNSVRAFVLTDWGNAAAAFYRRSGDGGYREEARKAFERALELNPRALVALRGRADLYSSLEDDPAALENARKDLTDLLEHEPRWAPGQLELVSTELALAEKTIAQVASERKALATNAETAVEKLFGMEGIMPASWLTRAKAIEKMSQPDRRQTDAVLNTVTGPMAPRALTLRARANALSDDMRDAARHLCTFIEAHFLPSDYDLRRLLLRLAEAATPKDAVERHDELRKRLRDIVIRTVETDPPHYYWLRKLKDKELEVPEEERIRLLQTAVTWPGAPACTLRWIAKELESSDERRWIREARSRAARKERRMTAMERDLVAELRRRARKAGQRTRKPSRGRKPADAQTSRPPR